MSAKADPNSIAAMTAQDSCGEKLSCLLDGELDAAACAALIERLRSDEQARLHWSLLAAAGDAMRSSEVAACHSAGFGARMAAALAAEPTIVAPRRWGQRRLIYRVVLPGAAVAAATLVLGIVAVPQLRQQEPVLSAGAVPIEAAVAASSAEADAGLEDYLVAHREAAGGTVMPRSAAYLRTANTPTSPAR
ncbi:MAG TPA: sigma-E factor negative regulatory protein [Burkholderiaceae bacterium]|nr:sigma-E factor negative regulatory protein [Burkholderiaceae bacterium]